MAVKMTKKSLTTDMTAMCDVAFLLLTFFILTATSKIPEAMTVDMPSSTVQSKLPETDLATLTVGKGKVFFDLKGKEVRIEALEKMAEKYGVEFTEEDKKDSLNNQLADWLRISRQANMDINDKDLEIAIKGDAKEEYPAIRKVMDILQDQGINSFSLVTGLRGKDF
jgi:biopolymer transport protein ExbD